MSRSSPESEPARPGGQTAGPPIRQATDLIGYKDLTFIHTLPNTFLPEFPCFRPATSLVGIVCAAACVSHDACGCPRKEKDGALDSSQAMETQLVDLHEALLSQVRLSREELEPFIKELMDQVDRPRFNLGSGPPGRVD